MIFQDLRNTVFRAVLFPAHITPCPANAFPNILAANIPNSVGRNPPFVFFVSFLNVSLTSFMNKLDSFSDFFFT